MECEYYKSGVAEVPMEGNWIQIDDISKINGVSHGVGGCPPHQGACKLTLNVKNGIIREALVETVGCSGITQSAVIASEILVGKNLLEALNTHLVCDAINDAMKNAFYQFVYGRTQTAFSKKGLPVGSIIDELAEGKISHVGTVWSVAGNAPVALETTEGYITKLALDENGEVIGYQFISIGRLLDDLRDGAFNNIEDYIGVYGRYNEGVVFKNVREEKNNVV